MATCVVMVENLSSQKIVFLENKNLHFDDV